MIFTKIYGKDCDAVYLIPHQTYDEAKRSVLDTGAWFCGQCGGEWYRHWCQGNNITDFYIISAQPIIATKFNAKLTVITADGSGTRTTYPCESVGDLGNLVKQVLRKAKEYNQTKVLKKKIVSLDFSIRQMYPTEKQIDIKKVLPWYGEYKDAYSDGRLFECEEILKAV